MIAIKVNEAQRSFWLFMIKSALAEKERKHSNKSSVDVQRRLCYCSTNMPNQEIMKEDDHIKSVLASLVWMWLSGV